MDRINGTGTIDIGSGRRGFRDENLGTGIEGTEVTALFLNMVQEEISKVIEDAGIVLNPADWTQLSQALGLRFAARNIRAWVPVLSMTTSAPPANPAIGDTYLVPTGATGIWAGKSGSLAEWLGLTWAYSTPSNGHGVSLPNGQIFVNVGGTYVEKIALDAQSGKWNYALAAGTADALTVTLAPLPAALTVGMRVFVKIAAVNTSATPTLNVNGTGAKTIIGNDGSSLPQRALVPSMVAQFEWDGTNWRLLGYTTLQSPPRNITAFSVAGTYTYVVPAGVYKIYGKCVGAGAGASGLGTGSTGTPYPGGSGAAGGTAEGWTDVTPGQNITIVVGAAGVGGAGAPSASAGAFGSDGGSGGTSSIGAFMSATGGLGGSGSVGGGGQGGVGTGGQINLTGGMGQDGGMNRSSAIGGNGGASSMGGGGRAATAYSAVVCDGKAPGSGGGSVYNSWTSQAAAKGGDGAPGIVYVLN